MRPTKEERAFLLRCAKAWDRVSRHRWIGDGLCVCVADIDFAYRSVGLVPSMRQQLQISHPPKVWSVYWWPQSDNGNAARRAHARKLAARCRFLALGERRKG